MTRKSTMKGVDDPTVLNLSRRAVLIGAGASALVLGFGRALSFAAEAQATPYGGDAMPGGLKDDPGLFVAIAPDGSVTVICHRAEMGQGVRTSLAMVVADELEADWSRVRVLQAVGDEKRYGNQNTDGSRTMRHHFMPMRRVGASARAMLETAAAARWGVPASEVTSAQHLLTHTPTGRTLGYGEVAEDAARGDVPTGDALVLKEPADFRMIGKGDTANVDGFAMTTGRATYGIDTRIEGMLHAVVARPPVYGGSVRSFDPSKALALPGVKKVIEIANSPLPSGFQPLGGIAVIATNTWAAIRGREALAIEWEAGPHGDYDSVAYRADLEAAARQPGKVIREEGDFDSAFAGAKTRIEAEYYVPHLSQAPMEPPAATARVDARGCEVWACVQAPEAVRAEVGTRLSLPPERVLVHQTLLGGGFGRKSKPDFVVEAALCSRAMDGTPVKVTWTREDDIRHGFYHAVSLERLEAGLDDGGRAVAFRHRSVAPSVFSTFAPDQDHLVPFERGLGLVTTPYDIPNFRVENPAATGHVRIGWFRSVASIPHAFAVQSFAAEVAEAKGQDPLEALLELIGPERRIPNPSVSDDWNHGEDPARYAIDTGRWARVAKVAAREAGWGRALPPGRGLGVAAHYSFVTYVGAVVEVVVDDDGTLTIPRVDLAVDCGPQVNPDRIRSQMEGSVIMGLALATSGEISFAGGRCLQGNFDDYPVTRIDAAPREIHVHLLPSDDWDQPLGGIGEPGVPPIAPALANALFQATGKRIRSLPIGDQLKA